MSTQSRTSSSRGQELLCKGWTRERARGVDWAWKWHQRASAGFSATPRQSRRRDRCEEKTREREATARPGRDASARRRAERGLSHVPASIASEMVGLQEGRQAAAARTTSPRCFQSQAGDGSRYLCALNIMCPETPFSHLVNPQIHSQTSDFRLDIAIREHVYQVGQSSMYPTRPSAEHSLIPAGREAGMGLPS